MSALPYTSGPAQIYVHDGTSWAFLGYSESGARINWIRSFEDFMSDRAGTKMPADMQFMGLEALVSCDLKEFDHTVLNVARRSIRGRSFGAGALGDLGQFMVYQNNAYRLNIRQPYADPAVWGGASPFPNMPLNIHFLHAIMIDESESVSTKAKLLPLVWHMKNYVNPCTGVWDFFNTDPGSLPSPC